MRLRILSSSTCVGFRYGHLKNSLEDFLGSLESVSWQGRSQASSPYSRLRGPGFAKDLPLLGNRTHPDVRTLILLRLPIGGNASQAVQEC